MDTVKQSASTKKPRVKRRLEFSASDYKSKKRIRLKSDVIISIRPVEVKKPKILAARDQQIPAEEVCFVCLFCTIHFSDGKIILEVSCQICL